MARWTGTLTQDPPEPPTPSRLTDPSSSGIGAVGGPQRACDRRGHAPPSDGLEELVQPEEGGGSGDPPSTWKWNEASL